MSRSNIVCILLTPWLCCCCCCCCAVQRICKYPLLLREVIKYTADGTEEQKKLQTAMAKIEEVSFLSSLLYIFQVELFVYLLLLILFVCSCAVRLSVWSMNESVMMRTITSYLKSKGDLYRYVNFVFLDSYDRIEVLYYL